MPPGHIVIAGLGSLALAVLDRLQVEDTPVTLLASATEAASWAPVAARRGVRLVAGSATTPDGLAAAGIESAAVLILTGDDDAENVDAALTARRLRGDLPMVLRIFDAQLGEYLRRTLEAVTVLSVSAIAAPVFADAAARAIASSPRAATATRLPRLRGARPPAVDRVVVTVALATVLLVTGATAYFEHALGLDWLDSLYFVWTTVLTVGYGDITPRHASAGAKLAAMALMLAGAALVAVFYALLAGFVVSRRLAVLRGHVPVFGRGHLIVAGAGHVGVRVAERLLDAGHRAVVIERDQDSPHIQQLRARGCHVIVADASAAETLDLAAVDRASAVLALTDSDATNLRVALATRARRPDLPVIARLASSDLSAHVSGRHDAIALSSVDLASEAFARAALDARAAHSPPPTHRASATSPPGGPP